jgi:hypothetical protein
MGGNQQIQNTLAQQIQAIQSGADKGYDPLLDQSLATQEQQTREQLRRNLGGDYETSSAGIEALARFNQGANTQRGSSRFNMLNALLNQQQQGMGNIANQSGQFGSAGANIQGQQFNQGATSGQMFGQNAGQMYNQGMGFGDQGQQAMNNQINRTGQTQQLYANVPQTMGQFGQALGQQSQYGVQAQRPYQDDRTTAFRNEAPSNGMMWGQMAAQSGDRWANIGTSMMGSGGGAAAPQQNQFGGAAGTGQGDPNWQLGWQAGGA